MLSVKYFIGSIDLFGIHLLWINYSVTTPCGGVFINLRLGLIPFAHLICGFVYSKNLSY